MLLYNLYNTDFNSHKLGYSISINMVILTGTPPQVSTTYCLYNQVGVFVLLLESRFFGAGFLP